MNKSISLEHAKDILSHAHSAIEEAERLKSISTDIESIKIQESYIKQFKDTEDTVKEYIDTIIAA